MRRKQLPNEQPLENDTLQSIRHQLTHFATKSDVEHREMKSEDKQVNLLFVKSICDNQAIVEGIVQPFWEMGSIALYQHYIRTLPGCTELTDLSQVKHLLTHGKVAVFFADCAYLIELTKALTEEQPGTQATVETIVEGPDHAFTENIKSNLNRLRMRYQSPHLQIDTQSVGELSPTQVALVYDKSRVNQTALDALKKELEKSPVDLLVNGGHLQRILTNKKWSLFPLMLPTECPDRVVFNMSQGKVIVLVDYTPEVLILPAIFSDFFVSMNDLYQLPVIGKLWTALRYMGLFIGVTLPALFVSIASFHPEFFRAQFIYPAFLEVIFMLLMMELLTETSLLLPRNIAPVATLVGGLILGLAVTQTGLVSNIMIVLVVAVALFHYVVKVAAMSFSMRVVRYFLLVLAALYGLVGVGIGLVALIFYLSNQTSYGTPYLKMFRKAGPS